MAINPTVKKMEYVNRMGETIVYETKKDSLYPFIKMGDNW
jgi:hypothetical protein